MYLPGERALLKDEPATATIVAATSLACYQCDRATFNAVLGSLQELLDNEVKRRDRMDAKKSAVQWTGLEVRRLHGSDAQLVSMHHGRRHAMHHAMPYAMPCPMPRATPRAMPCTVPCTVPCAMPCPMHAPCPRAMGCTARCSMPCAMACPMPCRCGGCSAAAPSAGCA